MIEQWTGRRAALIVVTILLFAGVAILWLLPTAEAATSETDVSRPADEESVPSQAVSRRGHFVSWPA